ncbi:MAG: AAA family ATPase [Chloroflexi bacterium]|nr:AAA family ATPase [Chloroflexota bacterium]
MTKLAITGKGGVGKTTLAALLAYLYAEEGRTVIAIDADPDANLASALGFPAEITANIIPIAEMKELVAERTGAQPGTMGGFFKINPRVDDIPDRFAGTHRGIKLLMLGTVQRGGGGCICPESALLRTLMQELLVRRQEVVILDMEAGLEHLGRSTAAAVDAFIVVVEPGLRSIQTANSIRQLAQDIGVKRIYIVGNKVRGEADRDFVYQNLPGYDVIGFLPYDENVIEADLRGEAVFDLAPALVAEARRIKSRLCEAV